MGTVKSEAIRVNWQDRHLLEGTWISPNGYACRKADSGKTEYLHRIITQAPNGAEVDHINGDKTDNRRRNLRVCTHQQNIRGRFKRTLSSKNRSGYLGVRSYRGKWRAQITVDGKFKCLGVYRDARRAAVAYDRAAKAHFGKFATLNIL